MNTYYYSLKNGKELWYSVKGFYEHSELPKGELVCNKTIHSRTPQQGQIYREFVSNEFKELENGDRLEVTKTIIKKVTQGRKDLKCNGCGQLFTWKGYKVWIEKEITKPKKMFEVMGMPVMEGGEKKIYWARYFNRKGQQTKFIKNFLAKEK